MKPNCGPLAIAAAEAPGIRAELRHESVPMRSGQRYQISWSEDVELHGLSCAGAQSREGLRWDTRR
ncbi:hypothetical protein N7462_004417 [Penicillium macrosclerotiorum]|uniref:uncharacterized protein n=1 Tax=Penicillium macrosclerotiorum TaxID=303699 RepID=UPI002546C985|nr:uncharacterized protein N7462_004417 [Penicillium macrosclerotiorum]KAJ5690025.1 hypothetical protein N7462_004417 [Penicillium macrosclerotiorum]